MVKRDGKCRLNNLAHHLSDENLKQCFSTLKKGKAAGVDAVSVEEYGEKLEQNVSRLVQRMKAQEYHSQPVRRTYIAKANGKMRALGIPAVEDKIIQRGITDILEAIYEVEFLYFSYGFRPHRSCHQALKQLNQVIMTQPINDIIDTDIKGFFDNVDHDWKTLRAKLRGHFQYYGVSGNFRSINSFEYQSKQLILKWLNRRSQKKSFNWDTFTVYLKRHPLPTAAIHHNFYTGFA